MGGLHRAPEAGGRGAGCQREAGGWGAGRWGGVWARGCCGRVGVWWGWWWCGMVERGGEGLAFCGRAGVGVPVAGTQTGADSSGWSFPQADTVRCASSSTPMAIQMPRSAGGGGGAGEGAGPIATITALCEGRPSVARCTLPPTSVRLDLAGPCTSAGGGASGAAAAGGPQRWAVCAGPPRDMPPVWGGVSLGPAAVPPPTTTTTNKTTTPTSVRGRVGAWWVGEGATRLLPRRCCERTTTRAPRPPRHPAVLQ